jgi:hypothetical protein
MSATGKFPVEVKPEILDIFLLRKLHAVLLQNSREEGPFRVAFTLCSAVSLNVV